MLPVFEKPAGIFLVRESVNVENQSFSHFTFFLPQLGGLKIVALQKR
jgi:hypothetical protein